MIKVLKVLSTFEVEHDGRKYPAASVEASLDGEPHACELDFSSESLSKAILNDEGLPRNLECCVMDERFYGYVPEECFRDEVSLKDAIERFLD